MNDFQHYGLRKLSGALSERLRSFSFICACLVVIIHLPRTVDSNGFPYWFQLFISMGICKIAVPFFFIASGFFLCGHINEPDWWRKEMRKRVWSLFVPYVIWATIGGFGVIINDGLSLKTVAKVYGLIPWMMPSYGVLWFIRSLIVLVVISPFLLKISNWFGVVVLYVLHGILGPDWSSGSSIIFLAGPVSLFAMTYFVLGMTIRLQRNRVPKLEIDHGFIFLGIGCVLIGIRAFMYYHNLSYQCYVVWMYVPLLLLGIWCLFSELNKDKTISLSVATCAFPLYVMHCLILRPMRALNLPATNFVILAMMFLVCVVLCLCITIFIRRVIPAVGSYLFGGR